MRETARRDLNLTAAALALHTSQPGLSKAIREFEEELGVTIFVRHGKRLTQVTDAGRQVLAIVDRILLEIDNLKRTSTEWRDAEAGELRIAATHTQARYSLPPAIAALRLQYPQVVVRLHQGNPTQIVEMLRGGQADIGIATEAIGAQSDLDSEALFCWYHCAIAQASHPLARFERVTLEQLAEHDLITYDPEFAGRGRIDQAFATRTLRPRIVLEATDSDVIKTYVRLGLGVGIVSELALGPSADGSVDGLRADSGLVTLPIGRPFERNLTRAAWLAGRMLRGYERSLIEGLKR
ncbi:MAG: LysR substrate-binding domain-containing protein [Lautropia sp.]